MAPYANAFSAGFSSDMEVPGMRHGPGCTDGVGKRVTALRRISSGGEMTDSARTAIITGANSGLGLQCARSLLATDPSWHVVLAVRDPGRDSAPRSDAR
jgi:hypothetical protein